MLRDRVQRAGVLTLGHREEIRAGIKRRETDAGIASRIRVHRGTVGREIAANGGRGGYRAFRAQDRADQQARQYRDVVPAGTVLPANTILVRGTYLGSPTAYEALQKHEVKFTQFSGKASAFMGTSKDTQLVSFCPPPKSRDDGTDADEVQRSIRPNIEVQPRYAIISKDTPPSERSAIFELYNSKENMHGDYIKVIIVSPVGQYGINLFSTTNVDFYAPVWTPTELYQATNRVFREVAYIDLINEMVNENINRGIDVPRNKLVIPVKIHLYAAYTRNSNGEYTPTADEGAYLAAESKDKPIRRIMRIGRQLSVDCQIQYNRNVRPDIDRDGTPVCDYEECEYVCADPSQNMLTRQHTMYIISMR